MGKCVGGRVVVHFDGLRWTSEQGASFSGGGVRWSQAGLSLGWDVMKRFILQNWVNEADWRKGWLVFHLSVVRVATLCREGNFLVVLGCCFK